jgi:uncharacterized protein YfaS (alpha-2-macroglobulin family)
MRNIIFHVFILISCLFVISCSTTNEIRISATNFKEEINQSQNLVFTFSKDLVNDSKLNQWDTIQYIKFEPAVKGKFKWTASNELVFSPLAGFSPATDYTAKINPLIINVIDKENKLDLSTQPIRFHTPYLVLASTEAWWTISKETTKNELRIRLHFNYPIRKQDLADRLKIASKNANLDYRILSSSNDTALDIALINPLVTGKEPIPITIKIDKGLKTTLVDHKTTAELSKVLDIPSPLQLEIVDIKTGFENNGGFVQVITSHELQEAEIAHAVSLDPDLTKQIDKTENGFIIRADFNEVDTYHLGINSNLRSVVGPHLEDATTKELFFGKMPSSITFTNKKAIYMTPKGSQNIGVQIVNVPKVQIKIAKLYANNILSYVRNNRWEDYSYVGEEWKPNGEFQYGNDEEGNYSDIVVDKIVDTENLPKNKGVSALHVSLPSGNERKGIYMVSVNSKDEAYLGQTKLISISDIGLIVKQGKDEIWVFANSIKNNDPLPNVEVTLVSSNNQQIVSLITKGQGSVHFDNLSKKFPGAKIAMITATQQNDFNYLLLQDTRTETSRFEVDGYRENVTGLQAFLYGEREIYRPGEVMHFNTIVRSENWKAAASTLLKLRLLTPNGREYRAWRKTTNLQGAVETEVKIDEGALTGTYVMEVYNANDILLTTKNISVEEFIPDRVKVDLKEGRNQYSIRDTIRVQAVATNLFGPPASNRKYEMEFQLQKKSFKAPQFPQYNFDIPAENTFEKTSRQGITDANGQLNENFDLSASLKDIGLLEGKVYVTVFDENGRPINRLQRFDILTQSIFYGIKMPDSYVGINAPVPIDLVGVNYKGELKKTAAKVEIVRLDYQTVVEKKNGQLSYVSRKSEKIVYSHQIMLSDGKAAIQYSPTMSGTYEIRVRRPEATHYTKSQFYAYGMGHTQYSSFEVSNEGRVLMETDKPKYKLGETAKILFKTPFDGRLLVTVERDRVQEQHMIMTNKKSAELKLSIHEKHLPNVYISAVLIRPLDASDMPLTVAHGFIPLLVEDVNRQLPITIQAVTQSRSKKKQRISVKTSPNAQVTIAVVDEGILQIKNTATPNIFGYFYQKRALEVSSHDLYAFLFPDLPLSSTSSFGGDGYNLGKRINPLSNGRTKLVTYWSGILETNRKGEAIFDIDIPQFSGDLRVMAVAFKGNAFGSVSNNIKVSDPIVISAGLPRFLSPEDALTLPINISNTEAKAASATVSVVTQGLVSNMQNGQVQKINIPAGQEISSIFQLKALPGIGNGKVTIQVDAFGEKFVHTTDLTIRPASPLLKTSQSGIIPAGKTTNINLTHNFMANSSQSQIVFSRSPLIQGGGKAFASLLGYPFGCLEQTISKAFPQIYFGDLSKAMALNVQLAKRENSDFNPTSNVQQAILKLESQQLFNGGFGMWPGANKEDWWVTAYAVHFMEEAKRAGFEIKASVFNKALDYLTSKTQSSSLKSTTTQSERDGVVKAVATREAIYSLYVLSLTGQPNRASMNYYLQNTSLLTVENRYLLSSTFKMIGDLRNATKLLPKNYDPKNDIVDEFSSPLRNVALVLNTLLETDADHPQIPQLARQLSTALSSTPQLNTQEAAFSVLALGKMARKTSNSTVTAKVMLDNAPLANFEGKELRLVKGIDNKTLQVTSQGSGNLYWFAQSEGMSATGSYIQEDHGLKIRRTLLTKEGKPFKDLQQNDLAVIKLTLSSTSGLPIENVVVTDLLPAGFEIENPRITEGREMPWIKNPTVADYMDIRDDRIHFFTNAEQKEKNFYYQVRVVSKGTFRWGPASADAMYRAEYRSYSGGNTIQVK